MGERIASITTEGILGHTEGDPAILPQKAQPGQVTEGARRLRPQAIVGHKIRLRAWQISGLGTQSPADLKRFSVLRIEAQGRIAIAVGFAIVPQAEVRNRAQAI